MSLSFSIETPADSEVDKIHAALRESYWSPGIPRETVARALAHSVCALARDEDGALAGVARAVTDRATFAWLCDVFVWPPWRGRGVARGLVGALRAHRDMQGLRRWLLATRDAHGVYAALGFTPLEAPERFMHLKAAAPYGKTAG